MSRAMMICILATSLAVGAGCSAQTPRLTPRVLAQKLYDQLDQANAKHDLNQVLGFYDSSYVSTDQRGKREAYAEWRRGMEQAFPLFRHVNPKTTVKDVQLEAGRMVVYTKSEWHFELYDQRNGWGPEIFIGKDEDTWEKKGGQWKLVRETSLHEDFPLHPKWNDASREKVNACLAREASRAPGEICLTDSPAHPCPPVDIQPVCVK